MSKKYHYFDGIHLVVVAIYNTLLLNLQKILRAWFDEIAPTLKLFILFGEHLHLTLLL